MTIDRDRDRKKRSVRRPAFGLIKQEELSSPDYRGYLADLVRRGDFVPLKRALCKALGLQAAALALQLANVGQARCDDRGFVEATVRFLLDGIGMHEEEQEVALDKLESLAIAKVEYRRGERTSVRWIRIDVKMLAEVVRGG